MRILYGVVGEGMGHATRSGVILDHLVNAGHDVRIVVSGRAADYLEQRHPSRVTKITGLTMVYEDNAVSKFKTALQNLKAVKGLPKNMQHFLQMARDFSPHVVISDFESWTYTFAKGNVVPIISVDNMQIIPRCHHDEDVLQGDMRSFRLAKNIVRAKLPRCNHYLITTFFYPPVKRDRTSLHPPILRPKLLEARARTRVDDHVLVYQTGTSNTALLEMLHAIDAPFRVYGMRRDITESVTEGNVTFCPFSEDGFIDDLASCRAVLAGGGFTLMGEAVVLGKPMLSLPLVGQFEQILNANYLAKLGFGERTDRLTEEGLAKFLARTPTYRANLAEVEHDGNEGFLARLDQQIEAAVAEGARGMEG